MCFVVPTSLLSLKSFFVFYFLGHSEVPFLPPLFSPLKDNLCPSSIKLSPTTIIQRNSSFKFMAFILCSIQLKYCYIYLAFYRYLTLTLFLLFFYASGLATIQKHPRDQRPWKLFFCISPQHLDLMCLAHEKHSFIYYLPVQYLFIKLCANS